MGIKLLPIPTGIDVFLQRFQEVMYEYLIDTWTITDDSYNCFGRAYRNKGSDGYIPEFYDPAIPGYVGGDDGTTNGALSGGLNGGLFYQDTLSAMSFFGTHDPIDVNQGQSNTRISVMFFVDLSKITPGGISQEDAHGQRLDEVCINDVKNFIQLNGNGLVVIKEYRDIDKVLERYSGSIKRDALEDNMHPKFCFRIDCTLNYNTYLNT